MSKVCDNYTPEMQLRDLILANPDLPLVPFCSEECGNPDYGIVMCEFRWCRVDEWAVSPYNKERIVFKSDEFEEFWEVAECDRYEDVSEEQARSVWDAIEWQKAIIVEIDGM